MNLENRPMANIENSPRRVSQLNARNSVKDFESASILSKSAKDGLNGSDASSTEDGDQARVLRKLESDMKGRRHSNKATSIKKTANVERQEYSSRGSVSGPASSRNDVAPGNPVKYINLIGS